MKHFLLPLFALLALAGRAVQAQTMPPVLNAPPTAPPLPAPASPPPAATLPANTAADAPNTYLLGRMYRVETQQGTTFTGTLVSINLKALEFDANELGHITLERSQIRQADLQSPRPATVAGVTAGTSKAGYYDIGNGNRLFFAPTARGLRQGEAVLQDVDVYLVGINYGITNNLSLGGYVSVFPGTGLDNQFIAFTPKLSYPIGNKLHAGFGLLYVRVPSFDSNSSGVGAGIGYGAITYGSADNNITAGLGYGFVEGEIGSTPIIQIGAQTRVSRLMSLVSENYIVADHAAGMAGLYGVKFNWRRTSLGLGALYYYEFEHTEPGGYYTSSGQYVPTGQSTGGQFYSTRIVPVYADFSFRFGKSVKQ